MFLLHLHSHRWQQTKHRCRQTRDQFLSAVLLKLKAASVSQTCLSGKHVHSSGSSCKNRVHSDCSYLAGTTRWEQRGDLTLRWRWNMGCNNEHGPAGGSVEVHMSARRRWCLSIGGTISLTFTILALFHSHTHTHSVFWNWVHSGLSLASYFRTPPLTALNGLSDSTPPPSCCENHECVSECVSVSVCVCVEVG